VNGEVGENGLDADITATTKALGELQFEEEDDEAYYNKVWRSCSFHVLLYSDLIVPYCVDYVHGTSVAVTMF
jgi:hypothetical protein